MSESVLAWVCGSCWAYLRRDDKPRACPVCGSSRVYLAGKVREVPEVKGVNWWLDW